VHETTASDVERQQASDAAREQLARDSWAELRRQAEAGELPDVPLPPPPPPPKQPEPSFDLSKSDPEGWAEYQRGVSNQVRREHAKRQRAAAAVLPPLGKGQNMYALYDANGNVVKAYTVAQALELPPEEARKLTPTTYNRSLWEVLNDAEAWAIDAWKVAYLGGEYAKDPDPPLIEDLIDDADDIADDAKDVVDTAADDAKKAADAAESFADKLVDAGDDLLNDLEGLLKYAPYIVLALGAAAVVYTVKPMLSGSKRSE